MYYILGFGYCIFSKFINQAEYKLYSTFMTGSESVVSYRYFSKGIKNQRVKALFENKHILTKNHRFHYIYLIFSFKLASQVNFMYCLDVVE